MLKEIFFKMKKKERCNVYKPTVMDAIELNMNIAPSVFETEGHKFLGDYIGKFIYGYEYKVQEGLIILDSPAKIIRCTTFEESKRLESNHINSKNSWCTPIVFINDIQKVS